MGALNIVTEVMGIEVPEEVILISAGVGALSMLLIRLDKIIQEREERERLESSRNGSTRRAS